MKKRIFSLMAVVMFVGSSISVNALAYDDCVDWAWRKADLIANDTWSSWDYWEVTNHYYEECINQ